MVVMIKNNVNFVYDKDRNVWNVDDDKSNVPLNVGAVFVELIDDNID